MATKKAQAKKAAKNNKAAKQPLTEQDAKLLDEVNACAFLSHHEKERWERDLTDPEHRRYLGPAPKAPKLEDYVLAPAKTPAFVTPKVHEDVYDARTMQWHSLGETGPELAEVLDTLAVLCGTGKLNSRTWVVEAFKTRSAWEWFLEELSAYEQCFRIRDPWWFALVRLCEHEDVEERFSTAEDIAESLQEHADETGQLARLT